jgi:16S rRNA G966 N2-methylase RsmD
MNEQDFIEANKHKPVAELALLLSKKPELNKEFILAQINGIQKAKTKLPEFYKTPHLVYPPKLSMEQCSSEKTAIYKSKLLSHAELDSETIVDLTGGFGIDSFYFSKQYKSVCYIEPQQQLFNTVSNNFKLLGTDNIKTINQTAEDFLKSNTKKFDVAFIDPSRRNENQKVFQLGDCIPNIVDLQHEIFKVAPKILVKTSPILDLKQSIKELKTVAEVWVISVNNECKEVLYLLEDKLTPEIKINAVNLIPLSRGEDFVSETKEQSNKIRGVLKEQSLSFTFNEEENNTPDYSEPLQYLYEPNASILKAGAFKSVSKNFNVKKIASNTHLYTSEEIIENFPGRTFNIEKTLPYNTKDFKKLRLKKANVSCRNFPDTVEQVKKKLNLKDGGDDYIFAVSGQHNKALLIITKK